MVEEIHNGENKVLLVWQLYHDSTFFIVKVIDMTDQVVDKREWEWEVTTLAKLNHRNVLWILNSVTEAGKLYIMTEYCEKSDLATYIQNVLVLTEGKIWSLFI